MPPADVHWHPLLALPHSGWRSLTRINGVFYGEISLKIFMIITTISAPKQRHGGEVQRAEAARREAERLAAERQAAALRETEQLEAQRRGQARTALPSRLSGRPPEAKGRADSPF